MRQGIDLVSQDQVLSGLFDDMKKAQETAKQRMKFVSKQAETIMKETNDVAQKLWNDVQSHLIEKGKLPNTYDKTKQTLHFDSSTGLIYMTDDKDDDGDHPLKKLLEHLMH